MVIGVALLLGDHRGTLQGQAIGASRGALDSVTRPVSNVIAAPVRWIGDGVNGVKQYFFAVSENRHLRAEVADLSQWRDKAVALKDDNARYQSLLGLKTDPPIPMIGARVLDDRSNSRAILTGDGGATPKLAYLRGADPVKAGDRILTSGDGGLFPRGLPVGTVVQGLDGNWRVRLDSDDGPIDLVRILLFRDFSQLADQRALQAATVPPLPPAEAADVAARALPAPTPPPAAVASA